jgi:putative ABC transport system permease protein
MVLVEYGLLGGVAGLVGVAGALGLSAALAHWLFEIDWTAPPALVAGAIAGTTILVAIVGFLASADTLRRKPLATLKAE